MRLVDLAPQFRLYSADRALGKTDSLAEAQGITFECPVCQSGHWILVWFAGKGVPPEAEPTHRWAAGGTGYSDLTLSPSIDCTVGDPKCWHGFIQNGEVTGA